MSKKRIYFCSNCLSSIFESKKQSTCIFCNTLMVEKDEIIEDWINKYSPIISKLFNEIKKFYDFTEMIDNETAIFDNEKYELDDESYGLLNEIVDTDEFRLPIAIVLHTTGLYIQEYDWDDFEFNPPIDLMDLNNRVGFLFFLDFLSLAATHAILRATKHNNISASLSELVWAHKYFNYHLQNEVGGINELKEPKARWPVLIFGMFENYIPPVHAINSIWKEAEQYTK
ncbi:MAG: hypothetical protein HeimC3_47330 [Candidatus Heimdallarchaeota archaeon LC_3]|nr:MAG: hypothetical protein HeimC3_47330 [Candidatus Heimdallarchaeota archaeon LC_3]